MSKGILEFNLPEEYDEHIVACKAFGLLKTIRDLDEWLRQMIKHSDDLSISTERVRNKLAELSNHNDVSDVLWP